VPAVATFALSAVGADRPGIIAAIAERLVAHGANVTDSQMGILRGCFAMTLVVEGEVDAEALRTDLVATAGSLGLEALTLREVRGSTDASAATHVVSVYGADHPGILAAITGALAGAGANVCDLRTRLVESDAVYVMVVDIAVPEGGEAGALEAALAAVGEREGVDVSFRAADTDLL
jgi:glycine cleavage system transcriptional repressor